MREAEDPKEPPVTVEEIATLMDNVNEHSLYEQQRVNILVVMFNTGLRPVRAFSLDFVGIPRIFFAEKAWVR